MAYQIMEYNPKVTYYGFSSENNQAPPIMIPVVSHQYFFSKFEVTSGITQLQLIMVIIALFITLLIGIQIGKRKSRKEKKPKDKPVEAGGEGVGARNTCSHESPGIIASNDPGQLAPFYFGQNLTVKMITNGEISEEGQNKCESTADSQKKPDDDRSAENSFNKGTDSLSKKHLDSLMVEKKDVIDGKPLKTKSDKSSSTNSSPGLSPAEKVCQSFSLDDDDNYDGQEHRKEKSRNSSKATSEKALDSGDPFEKNTLGNYFYL